MSGDDTRRHTNKEWDEAYARAEKFYAENGKEMNGLDELGKAANFALAERDAATKEATEQACRDVCAYCKYPQHWKPAELLGERWRHRPITDATEAPCDAYKIRSRVAAQGEK